MSTAFGAQLWHEYAKDPGSPGFRPIGLELPRSCLSSPVLQRAPQPTSEIEVHGKKKRLQVVIGSAGHRERITALHLERGTQAAGGSVVIISGTAAKRFPVALALSPMYRLAGVRAGTTRMERMAHSLGRTRQLAVSSLRTSGETSTSQTAW